MKGEIVDILSGAKYFTSIRSLVALTMKEKILKCGERVYKTDQEGIYLMDANTEGARAVQNKLPKISKTARRFIDSNIRLHGVYQKLEEKTKERLDEVVKKECEHVQKISRWLVQNQITMANQIIGLTPHTNSFMSMVGEVVYNFKCEEVTVQLSDEIEKDAEGRNVCYNFAKILYQNETQFMKPKSRLISKTAERMPCSKVFVPMYESQNSEEYIKIGTEGIELVPKPASYNDLFATVSQFNITHTEVEFGPGAGIYTAEQEEATEAYLTYKDVQKAIDSIRYFDTTNGRVTNQENLKGPWTLENIASLMGGFDLKKVVFWIMYGFETYAKIYIVAITLAKIFQICHAFKQLWANTNLTNLAKITSAIQSSSNILTRNVVMKMDTEGERKTKDLEIKLDLISQEIAELKNNSKG